MISLVVDIRSDVIEGTLVDFSAASSILYSTHVELTRRDHATEDYITKMMVKGIEDLCGHIAEESRKYTKGRIDEVHYVLSSPWVIPQSQMVKKSFEKETEITEGVIKGILDEYQKTLEKTYESDMVFVEQKIFAVELNGYPIQNYKAKRAKSLQVSFAFTLSSDKIIKKIQGAAGRFLHVHREHYHSAMLLHYLAARARITDDKEYILTHIHGEVTDLIIVKKGMSAYLESFPFGSSTFLRKVSHALKASLEATASAIALYEESTSDEAAHKKIEKVLTDVMKGWQSDCTQVLTGAGMHIPHGMYLSSRASFLNLFKASLESAGFAVEIDTTPPLEIYTTVLKDMI